LIGRFLSGVFGAAPYAIGGGIFHDIYDSVHVQGGIAFFAVATAGGPALGPLIGTALATTSDDGWRWTGWFMLSFGMVVTVLLGAFMSEPYAPVILARMARDKRRDTGIENWWCPLDKVVITPLDVVTRYILRPMTMLCTEPGEYSRLQHG
jgi:MFS family permease